MGTRITIWACLWLGAVCCFTGVGYSQGVEWNYNNRAQSIGNGCPRGSVAFITAGEEISVVFSELGVTLTGQNRPRRQNKVCQIGIPVKITQGRYFDSLVETLVYGFVMQGQSEGQIEMNSQLFGLRANLGRRLRATDRIQDQPYVEAVNQRRLPRRLFCKREEIKALYHLQLKISGQRQTDADDLLLQVDGADIRFTLRTTSRACPSS